MLLHQTQFTTPVLLAALKGGQKAFSHWILNSKMEKHCMNWVCVCWILFIKPSLEVCIFSPTCLATFLKSSKNVSAELLDDQNSLV